MRESKVEKHLVARAEEHGALVRKLAYVGRRGASDRMVIWGERYRTVRVEMPPEILKPGAMVPREALETYASFATHPPVSGPHKTEIDFVELKAPGQKPDPHQEREHARLRALGCNVFVLDSIEAVDTYIKERT